MRMETAHAGFPDELTRPPSLVSLAMEALAVGCHVFSEKPVSDSLDGIDASSELAKRSGGR